MPPLPLLVFVVGMGSLGAEIAAVRLLAPWRCRCCCSAQSRRMRLLPRTHIDAVEIDAELSEIGRRYFDMRGPRPTLHHEDARRRPRWPHASGRRCPTATSTPTTARRSSG
jgi:hypothetical protein